MSRCLLLAVMFQNVLAQHVKDPASDGSGLAPYLSSPSFILFIVQCLLMGLILVGFGKSLSRPGRSLSFFLSVQFLVWVIIVNTLPSEGFGGVSEKDEDIVIWSIVLVCGAVGAVIGFWSQANIGTGLMTTNGAFVCCLGIILFGKNALGTVARYCIIGVLTPSISLVLYIIRDTCGLAAATSITGSFLFFLAVDLLVNQTSGLSLGLRYIFDKNVGHTSSLTEYTPLLSSKFLLALVWAFGLIFTFVQCYFLRGPLFSPRGDQELPELPIHSSSRTLSPQDEEWAEILQHSPGSSINGRVSRKLTKSRKATSPVPRTPTIQELADEQLQIENMYYYNSPRVRPLMGAPGMFSPDLPPSRPASILSSDFAVGLRSRPPTLFEQPYVLNGTHYNPTNMSYGMLSAPRLDTPHVSPLSPPRIISLSEFPSSPSEVSPDEGKTDMISLGFPLVASFGNPLDSPTRDFPASEAGTEPFAQGTLESPEPPESSDSPGLYSTFSMDSPTEMAGIQTVYAPSVGDLTYIITRNAATPTSEKPEKPAESPSRHLSASSSQTIRDIPETNADVLSDSRQCIGSTSVTSVTTDECQSGRTRKSGSDLFQTIHTKNERIPQ